MCIEKKQSGWKLDLKSLIQIVVILGALLVHYHFSTVKVAVKLENHDVRIGSLEDYHPKPTGSIGG